MRDLFQDDRASLSCLSVNFNLARLLAKRPELVLTNDFVSQRKWYQSGKQDHSCWHTPSWAQKPSQYDKIDNEHHGEPQGNYAQ